MPLSREETIRGLQREYAGFAELVRSLDDDQWRAPTRCAGWEVRDVAGHVVGIVVDLASGNPTARSSQEQAEAAHGKSAGEVADELDALLQGMEPVLDAITDEAWEGPSPAPELTMRQGVMTLWDDVWVHADDIRAAIGAPTERGPGLGASVRYLAEQLDGRGWGPARLELDGLEPIDIGAVDADTIVVRGDPHRFVLAATGRGDAAELGLDDKVNIYA